MQYYSRKPDGRRKQRLRRWYRYTPRRRVDTWQQPPTPIRTPTPPSPSESRYAAGYAPAQRQEPTTAPPLRRKVMDTDPELPRIAAGQSHVPPRANQVHTQRLPPGENDESSLGTQLERFALEIERAFKRMGSRARFVTIIILICLFLVLHLWLQVFWLLFHASWINPIYLLFGIIASAIVIYEFVRQFFEKK